MDRPERARRNRPFAPRLGRGPGPEALEPRRLMAASLLRDINTFAASPRDIVPAGDMVYFTASTPTGGFDLYRVAAGGGDAARLRHFATATFSDSSPFREFLAVDSSLYFVVQDLEFGAELWRSDGTATGTTLVKDLHAGPLGSYPSELTAVGSTVVFRAYDGGATGTELWRTDGTEAGTSVVDLWPGAGSGYPIALTPIGSTLYFFGNDGVRGNELWRIDGGAAGATFVADLVPGPVGNGVGTSAVALGSTLIFVADTDLARRTLWASDGTADGSVPLRTSAWSGPDSIDPAPPTVAGSVAFFLVHRPDGDDLWKTDGTPGGTGIVRGFASGAEPARLSDLVAADGLLYFWARTATGRALWRSDATAEGTIPLRQDAPGTETDRAEPSQAPLGGRLFFSAIDPALGPEVFESDGTPEGTELFRDILPGPGGSGPDGLVSDGRAIYFRARDREGVAQLFRSDGTPGGTRAIVTWDPGATRSSADETLGDGSPVGGAVLFAADDGAAGVGLWRTDGTVAGTSLVKAVAPDGPSTGGASLVFDGVLYFGVGTGPVEGRGLWRSDGTAEGTVQLAAIPGDGPGLVRNLRVAGGVLYFTTGYDGPTVRLWRSDGSAAGTRVVLEDSDTSSDGRIVLGSMVAIGSRLYYLRFDYSSARPPQLWTSDGTAEGTRPIVTVAPVVSLAVLGSNLLYASPDAYGGTSLRVFRGEGEGADDVTLGPPGSYPDALTVAGDRLYFTAFNARGRRELWMTDGTPGGTSLVPGYAPSLDTSWPVSLTSFGSLLLFSDTPPDGNARLWRTDGTRDGTFVLGEINIGGGYGPGFTASPFDGLGYFAADDGVHGTELWRTDGTVAGTRLAAELRPGVGASDPRILGFLPGGLVLSADDGLHGREPFFLADPAAQEAFPPAPIDLPGPVPQPVPIGTGGPASPPCRRRADAAIAAVPVAPIPGTIRLTRKGGAVTAIALRVGAGLDAASASRKAGYRVVRVLPKGRGAAARTGERTLTIRSARYDPESGLVRLRLRCGFVARPGSTYQVRVSGDALRDARGRGLDGDRDGRPGGIARFALFRRAAGG